MSVYQVEEFYICTTGMRLNKDMITGIIKLLKSEGFSDYEIQDGGQVIVNDIDSEHTALELEEKIYKIAGL